MSDRDELADFLDGLHWVLPNLSDTFAYASADTEQIAVGDAETLARLWRAHGHYALVAIAAWTRGVHPITPVRDREEYQAALAELRENPAEWPPGPAGKCWPLREVLELEGDGPPVAGREADR